MSWLTDLGDAVGSIFGTGNDWGSQAGGWLEDSFGLDSSTVIPGSDPGQKGGGLFSDSGFYKSLLNAGVGMGGIYANQKQNRQMLEEYAKQREAEINWDKEKFAQELALGYAKVKAQKKATLGSLYGAYGSSQQQMGESLGNQSIRIGENVSSPFAARAARLV
jgi:hypothetical protein